MGYSRDILVSIAQSFMGLKESDGSYKTIIDIYNGHTPLAQGYKMTYSDPWCATFVSTCAIQAGYTAIIPTECSCPRMITLFQNLNEWEENDSYAPAPGDILFYDWDDSGNGDNTGTSDHVGIVETVNGTTMTIIEGNYNDAVGRRTMQVNGKYIRGYGVPKYTENNVDVDKTITTISINPLDLNDIDIYYSAYADNPSGKITGTYYLWNEEIIKDRIQITNKIEYVGVESKVTGWIEVSDLEQTKAITSSYTNGANSTAVYSDSTCTNKIGSLNPYETCDCLGMINNLYIVCYLVDGTVDIYKVGFIK